MAQQESLLEMVQRHVVESQARVAMQTARVADLTQQGHNTARAEAELATLKNTLHRMCDVLAREQKRETRVHGPGVRRW